MKYFDISWRSTRDGPGNRTVLFLQGCNLRCEWCHSPHSQPMCSPVLYFESYCDSCGSCVAVCPRGCHKMQGETHIFDREMCDNCGNCTKAGVCETEALRRREYEATPEVLYGKLKSELRMLKGIGGLTISGGDPVLQYKEVKRLLRFCKEDGIHTAIETSAAVQNEVIKELADDVDCWLFGLKQTDPGLCKKMTNADITLVAENLRSLGALCGDRIIVRTPLIYPCTSSTENIETICRHMQGAGVSQIELMKYNALTPVFYEATGQMFHADDYRAATTEELEKVTDIIRSFGFQYRYIQ